MVSVCWSSNLVAVVPGAELINARQRAIGASASPARSSHSEYCNSAIARVPTSSGKLTPFGLLVGVLGESRGIGLPLKTPPSIVRLSVSCARPRTPKARQRIGGAAGGQIRGRQGGKTGDAIDEEGVGGRADDEFLIEALLADLDVEFVAELLLIPQLPQPDADRRLDVAQGLDDQEIVRGQVSAPVLEAAHVERAALETERLFGIHLQRHGGEAVRFKTLFDAARHVAERLDILEDRELNAVPCPGRA